MNRPADGLNEDANSVLRAVGSLLVALSGGGADQQATQRLLVTLEDQGRGRSSEARTQRPDPFTEDPRYPGVSYAPARPSVAPPPTPEQPARPTASMATPLPTDGSDPVEFILSDARERAQKILDESNERAQELLAQRRPSLLSGVDREAVDEMKRAITGLVTEVRDIRQRLGRIESLLIANQAAQAAAVAAAYVSPPQASAPSTAPAPAPEVASQPVVPRPVMVPPPAVVMQSAPEPMYEPEPEPEFEPEPAPIAAWESEPEAHAAPWEPAPAAMDEPSPWDAPQALPQIANDADLGELNRYASFATDFRTDFDVPVAPVEEPESVTPEPEVFAPIESIEEPVAYAAPIVEDTPAYDEPPLSAIAPIPSPAPSPPRSTFSVVPPQRREWSESSPPASPSIKPAAASMAAAPLPIEEVDPLDVPAPPPSAVPRLRYASPSAVQAEPAWDDLDEIPVSAPGESGAPIATFLPADGAIVLRVTPVSGFQGLMRVQDALARLPSVRQASVEAYSQGEARLRIELLDTTDSEEIAGGLGRSLRSPASVMEASESDRQLLISLR